MNKTTNYSLLLILLALLTVAAFWPALSHTFINYDDPGYVTENAHVRSGLTLENVRWAFSTTSMGIWHPLTWLSHMLDIRIFGMNPMGHHLTNILLHTASTLVLFTLLNRLTGALWQSALVAAIFAVHPLRVESVAWVSERKDTLSTLLYLTSVLFYTLYAQRPSVMRYLPVVALLALGLLAKPMLVTLPCALLLVDFWPLNRVRTDAGSDTGTAAAPWSRALGLIRANMGLLTEKLPLFMVSALFCMIAVHAQKAEKALMAVQNYPVMQRLPNVVSAYAMYLWKTVWPTDLAVLYPLPDHVPLLRLMLALVVLVAVTAVAFRQSPRRPYLLFGWLWFLGTALPVIGLVQIGLQSMADRYSYIPSIGLYVMVVWGLSDILSGRSCRTYALAITAAAVVVSLFLATRSQLAYWRDSITLFSHTQDVTRDNFVAHTNLANAYTKAGMFDEALRHYQESLKIRPHAAIAYYKKIHDAFVYSSIGSIYEKSGNLEYATKLYRTSLELDPANVYVHSNLGIALISLGRTGEAIEQFTRALRLNPDFSDAHYNLGLALDSLGKSEEAIAHFNEALRINPDDHDARQALGRALSSRGIPAR